MPDKSELKAEIGHVLLIDIVGYSKLLINQQGELLQTLKQLAKEMTPVERDAILGSAQVEVLGPVAKQTGQADRAVVVLKKALSIPDVGWPMAHRAHLPDSGLIRCSIGCGTICATRDSRKMKP